MNSTVLRIVQLPSSLELRGLKVSQLVARATQLEAVLATGVQKENTVRLYILLCQSLEEVALQALGSQELTVCTVDDMYLRVLMRQPDTEPVLRRLYAAFCTAEDAKGCALYLHRLAGTLDGNARRQVDAAAELYGTSYHKKQVLVLVQDHQATLVRRKTTPEAEPPDLAEAFRGLPVTDVVTDNSGKGSSQIFKEHVVKQIQLASRGIEHGLNPALASNPGLTEVLHDLSYRGDLSNVRALPVRVAYSDGSEARPFVAYALDHQRGAAISVGSDVSVMNIGMISARHPEIDKFVEMYWFPNALVSQTRASAETDELSYQHSIRMFADMRKCRGKFLIYFYQTGFQYALMGFLRALSEELARTPLEEPWLKIVPKLFAGKDTYRDGDPWC